MLLGLQLGGMAPATLPAPLCTESRHAVRRCSPESLSIRNNIRRRLHCPVARLGTPSGTAVTATASDLVDKAANLIKTSDKLVLFDPHAENMGLIVWQAIRDVPEAQRLELVSRLSSGDIRRAWKVAGKRYGATRSAAIAAIGPEYSIWEEMPSEEGEIVYFRGKAALPIHALGISSFSKAFFLAPGQQLDGGRGAGDRVALFGRVINPTALGNRVYPGPMYFRAAVGPTASSMYGEVAEMEISYLEPDQLGLDSSSLPVASWPTPAPQRRPFDLGYVDYVRALGPGVLVGMGYRTQAAGSGVPLVPSPLYFIMARQPNPPL